LTKPKQCSFIQIDIRYNHIFKLAKNVNDKSTNNLKTHKLIAYNGKMPTNDIIKSK